MPVAGSDTLRGPDGHRARPEVVPELHEAVDERDGEKVVLGDQKGDNQTLIFKDPS